MSYLRWIRNQWDRAFGVAAVTAGLVVLLAGWIGTSRAIFPAQQIPYLISGGLLGLFLLGLGATAWLSADMRDEWRKLDDFQGAVVASLGMDLSEQPAELTVPEQQRGPLSSTDHIRRTAEARR